MSCLHIISLFGIASSVFFGTKSIVFSVSLPPWHSLLLGLSLFLSPNSLLLFLIGHSLRCHFSDGAWTYCLRAILWSGCEAESRSTMEVITSRDSSWCYWVTNWDQPSLLANCAKGLPDEACSGMNIFSGLWSSRSAGHTFSFTCMGPRNSEVSVIFQ